MILKSKKKTVFCMIYAFIGDERNNIYSKNDKIKIILKKGNAIESLIYGWEGKTNADESLQSLSHRQ